VGRDVGEQHGLIDADPVRHLQERRIRDRHRGRLGLAARQLVRVAEHACLVALAADRMAAGAGATLAAADYARHDHAIAAAELPHVAPRLDDLADELVPEREARRNRQRAVVQAQVGAADRGALHAHDHAARVVRRGIRQ